MHGAKSILPLSLSPMVLSEVWRKSIDGLGSSWQASHQKVPLKYERRTTYPQRQHYPRIGIQEPLPVIYCLSNFEFYLSMSPFRDMDFNCAGHFVRTFTGQIRWVS